jgi:hypothetical protein
VKSSPAPVWLPSLLACDLWHLGVNSLKLHLCAGANVQISLLFSVQATLLIVGLAPTSSQEVCHPRHTDKWLSGDRAYPNPGQSAFIRAPRLPVRIRTDPLRTKQHPHPFPERKRPHRPSTAPAEPLHVQSKWEDRPRNQSSPLLARKRPPNLTEPSQCSVDPDSLPRRGNGAPGNNPAVGAAGGVIPYLDLRSFRRSSGLAPLIA